MGHLNPPMILGTLGTIEATLTAMGAPMSKSGVTGCSGYWSGSIDGYIGRSPVDRVEPLSVHAAIVR